ncbi:MAG TPA: hypothetical protein V6C72_02780, partial [Chroococcales cyanobacterium]
GLADAGEQSAAIQILQATLRFADHGCLSASRSQLWTMIGDQYLDLQDYKNANTNYVAAFNYGKRYGSLPSNVCRLRKAAWTYSVLKDQSNALSYARQAEAMSNDIKEVIPLQDAYLDMTFGRVMAESGERSKAIEYFNKALPVLQAGNQDAAQWTEEYLKALQDGTHSSAKVPPPRHEPSNQNDF